MIVGIIVNYITHSSKGKEEAKTEPVAEEAAATEEPKEE